MNMNNSKLDDKTVRPRASKPKTYSYILLSLVFGLASAVYLLWVYTDVSSNAEQLSEISPSSKDISRVSEAENDIPEGKTQLPMPETPPDLLEVKAVAYHSALASASPRPAELALRKSVSHYIKYNRQFADAQAQAEGISVNEVEELTYFGFLAQATQRWEEVEEVLGEALTEEIRMKADTWMYDLNDEFTATMREMVAQGATEPERWAYIREVQERYLTKYYKITGMTTDNLQDVLAGDVTRTYPVMEDLPPELTSQQNFDYPTPLPKRPETP